MRRTIFIGQAMPRIKKDPHDWPSLNNWLSTIDVSPDQIKDHFLYSALVDYFPGAKNGSHLIPTKQEIANERNRLATALNDFKPEIVVPIGRLSIAYCLQKAVEPLTSNIGNVYTANPYGLMDYELTVVPLPHPSGASTWRYRENNIKLLNKALANLKRLIK